MFEMGSKSSALLPNEANLRRPREMKTRKRKGATADVIGMRNTLMARLVCENDLNEGNCPPVGTVQLLNCILTQFGVRELGSYNKKMGLGSVMKTDPVDSTALDSQRILVDGNDISVEENGLVLGADGTQVHGHLRGNNESHSIQSFILFLQKGLKWNST